jgi:hypothetical protein
MLMQVAVQVGKIHGDHYLHRTGTRQHRPEMSRGTLTVHNGLTGCCHTRAVTVPFPEPTVPVTSRAEVFLRYLDYFRAGVISKVEGLPDDEPRRSRLPSGWTPLELVKHLTFVELRWIEWGFEGREVSEPWGDARDDRWYVADEETRDELVAALRARGLRTRAVIEGTDLAGLGKPGPRWDGADPPPLERVLFHLVQEYARHLGHLDIVAELGGGPVGE